MFSVEEEKGLLIPALLLFVSTAVLCLYELHIDALWFALLSS